MYGEIEFDCSHNGVFENAIDMVSEGCCRCYAVACHSLLLLLLLANELAMRSRGVHARQPRCVYICYCLSLHTRVAASRVQCAVVG